MSARYQQYLASREWAVLKQTVKRRSGGFCERDVEPTWLTDYVWISRLGNGWHHVPATQTHHLTYERLYHERPGDLLHVCAGCHEFLSAVQDYDPVLLDEANWHLRRLHSSMRLRAGVLPGDYVNIWAEGFGCAVRMPLEDAAHRLRDSLTAYEFFATNDPDVGIF